MNRSVNLSFVVWQWQLWKLEFLCSSLGGSSSQNSLSFPVKPGSCWSRGESRGHGASWRLGASGITLNLLLFCLWILSPLSINLVAVVWGSALLINFHSKFTHLSGKGQFRLLVADARITRCPSGDHQFSLLFGEMDRLPGWKRTGRCWEP